MKTVEQKIWEYRVLSTEGVIKSNLPKFLVESLPSLGENNWELVTAYEGVLIFKRPNTIIVESLDEEWWDDGSWNEEW